MAIIIYYYPNTKYICSPFQKKMKFFILLFCFAIACKPATKPLPILGTPTISGNDTIYPTIADFSVTNQNRQTVTNQTFSKKVYVADFIFLSCPTICPVMTKAMQNVFNQFSDNAGVGFISYTIDPEHDSIEKLKAYADQLGVTGDNWNFVTGNQDSILYLAQHSYFSSAYPDSAAPGGFIHSGGLLLVDKQRHIRGVYNSTKPVETQRLIQDINILLKE